MNRHRALPPGDCGMRGAVAGWPPGCGGTVHGAGGLVGRVEDHSSSGWDKGRTAARSLKPDVESWSWQTL